MKRPNLLFLFSDQHARSVAGCYGDTAALTPNLDRLAAQGVTFDHAYCPTPLCVPSRMSMLTGRYPFEQECWTNDDYLRSDAATWLHSCGAAGYRPALAGRLHSMGPDQLHGYAQRMVGDGSGQPLRRGVAVQRNRAGHGCQLALHRGVTRDDRLARFAAEVTDLGQADFGCPRE